ncbi:MAG: single-stranded-DNA-specific exonuclease RecJ [Oscillospiraceae bacterium]|nr:single-stranded-DNA-specific exonuclease RecJ [Oscillospiraceae bacterium]
MKNTKWITGKYDENTVSELMNKLGVPSLTAKLLAVRGIRDAESAALFLKKDLGDLFDPFLLKDMDRAVERIKRALDSGEKIAVYGDYDADGVTSTYILVDYLRSSGADCTYHIPDRFGDGYGVSRAALRALADDGVSLVVTVDTGITAAEEIAYAAELGLDVVVTDHHKCEETLPSACAVVNPNREDCGYPFKSLAGVGVAFKLISALSENNREIMEKYLPYVCIGTVADVMPITAENRIIVSKGLEIISKRENHGLSALLEVAGFKSEEKLTSGAVGFLIGPRMNAAGRMGSALLALELLFATEDKAMELAREIDEKNRERQLCESKIMEEALAVLEKIPEFKDGSAIVLSGKDWHQGVLGIVASRICGMFEKPTILISVEDGECRGSGRSVAGVSLHAALSECRDVLSKFGGHDLAAGVVVKNEDIDEFRRRLNEALCDEMRDYVPVLDIDFKASPSELTLSQLRALRFMEPYGKMNEAPKLRLDNCKISKISPIGNGRHTKIVIEHGARFQCVYFGVKCNDLPFSEGDYADIVFTPEINNYMGESVQLHIKDARPCEEDLAHLESALGTLALAERGERDDGVSVTYEELGLIWRSITRTEFPKSAPILEMKRNIRASLGEQGIKKLLLAFRIFSEVGLMSFECENFRASIDIAEHNNKVDINDSKTYNIYKSCGSR